MTIQVTFRIEDPKLERMLVQTSKMNKISQNIVAKQWCIAGGYGTYINDQLVSDLSSLLKSNLFTTVHIKNMVVALAEKLIDDDDFEYRDKLLAALSEAQVRTKNQLKDKKNV